MAPPAQILSSVLFTSLLLLLFISSCTSYSSPPYYKGTTNLSPVNDQKVNLSLYYETLCPGCQNFITDDNGLSKLFTEAGLINIVNLRFVPWGNAKLEQNDTIVCQHGEDECYDNTIHACIIETLFHTIDHFKMIYCTESVFEANSKSHESEVWRQCAKEYNYPPEPIQQCYDSGLGKQLELAYGKETYNLNPAHEFTPWVTVNGQPLREHFMDYIHYICNAYKGENPPKACKNSVPRNEVADSSVAGICVREDHYHQDSLQTLPIASEHFTPAQGFSNPPKALDLLSLIRKIKIKP